MPSKVNYLALEDALRLLDAYVKPDIKTEAVLVEEAYGRILASPVISHVDLPPHDGSHVDGYAVKSVDIAGASKEKPVFLKIAGRLGPGQYIGRHLTEGEAFFVSTGSYLPPGSDTVLPIEVVQVLDDRIKVASPRPRWDEVYLRGSDAKKGDRIFGRGHRIGAADLSLLKTMKLSSVEVFKRPKVSVLSLGSELTEDLKGLKEGMVLSSHNLMISSMLKEAGAVGIDMGVFSDDLELIKAGLRKGLYASDMALTIGGSSVGEKDLAVAAINSLGKPGVLVRGLKVQPGRVAGFGMVLGKPVVILPGLLQSACISMILFGLRIVRRFSGILNGEEEPTVVARLSRQVVFHRYPDFKHALWVRLSKDADGFIAEPVEGETPLVNVLVKANGLVLIDEGVTRLLKGERLQVRLVPGLSDSSIFTSPHHV